MSYQTEILPASPEGIAQAAALLKAGKVLGMPTETVYGLAGDACNDRAVARIYAAKNRPQFNPLIIHVQDANAAQDICDWTKTAQMLADAFWPGPLTLVLPKRDNALSSLIGGELNSVAIRAPAHAAAQGLLQAFGGPIAAPSANPSGQLSPTTAAHVQSGLTGKIAAILDGGPCELGLESTIIGLIDTPELLRPGGIPQETIEAVLGHSIKARQSSDIITAPGQLGSHYAPRAQLRLNATKAKTHEQHLGFGPVAGDLNLSKTGDLVEAAANLFAYLFELDNGADICVAPIPSHGLGRAINDRLTRAAAPRPKEPTP